MSSIRYTQGLTSAQLPVFPLPVLATAAPTSSNVSYPLGQIWINKSSGLSYILTQLSSGSATWGVMSPGSSEVDSLTGDSGGAIAPVGGNIDVLGGTNVTTAGTAGTITVNLDAAISLATSVTSPLYTASAADVAITAPTNQDVVIKLGDSGGTNKLSLLDSSDVEVWAVDSNGGQTFTSATFTGLVTAEASMTVETAGTALNLGSDNSGDAVNLGVGTVARAIGIGDSAAAHTITIGSATGAASLDLLAGSGNMTLGGAVAATITIGGAAHEGTITLGDSSATNTVQIGTGEGATTVSIATGTTSAKTVDIATGAVANVVTIGSATGAAQLDLLCGTGNFSLDGAATSTYTVGASTTSGTIAIGGAAQTGTITLGDSSGTNTVQIGSGEGDTTVNIAGGATNAKTVNIATGAVANVVTIGSASGAAQLDLLCGTGNFSLNGAATSTYTIGAATTSGTISIGGTAQTGTMTLAGGSGAQTINIANSTGGKTVAIATGAGANAVTIGSTNTTSALTLQAGSGDITVTGTVKEISAEFLTASGTYLPSVSQSPLMTTAANTAGVATGSNGDINLMYMQDGVLMEQFIIGAQTIIGPRMSANGLNIALDETNAKGAEYNFGPRSNAKHVFTIGTDDAFFAEATFYVEDYSGCAPLMMGFRKVEANNATLASYTDYACIGINQATSAVNATILDELNGGGQTATNTTDSWGAEPAAQSVGVYVAADGTTTFTVGGSAASSAPSFTFDNGDEVMFFIHFLNGADVAGEVSLVDLKIGYQA